MINPTLFASFLIRAMLLAGICCGGFGTAAAGPITPSGKEVAPPVAGRSAIELHGRAYLFRGALGQIFSRGMDRLTEQIQQAGITASVNEFTICRLVAATAIREYRQDPAPIILIGHSMGGLCALTFAEILQAEDIPVSLVVTIDPAKVSPAVPLNVERYINIFLSNSVLGGGDVVPTQGYHNHYISFDLSEHQEVSHINIDKMDSVHEQLVAKIVQLATIPAKAEAEAVHLLYFAPADTAIELWDSGMPVVARPGETLETIAASHHVPLWSLTQVNQTWDNVPLVPGQRVIVPRHLAPLASVAAVSRPSPSRR